MNNNIQNLYLFSTVACQLTEYIDEREHEALSADMTTSGYTIESILAHQNICRDD